MDSNAIIELINSKADMSEISIIATDDLEDEYRIIESEHLTKIQFNKISKLEAYDEVYYYKQYAYYIKNYKDFSFVSMSGFADVSILAAVKCIIDNFGKNPGQLTFDLPGMDFARDGLTIHTKDRNLRKALEADFAQKIRVMPREETT